MFNNVNNPFVNRKVASSTSSDSNGQRQKEDPKKELKKYIDEEEPDEVKIGGLKLKEENEGREKVIKKLDSYLEKFDVEKFMKKNPDMTSPDFYMVMYNETEGLIK